MSTNDDPSGRRPLSAEQLASYERPTEVDISPDGSLVAYVVAPVSKDVGKDVEHGVSSIWVVGSSGGEPRPFTGGQWEDASPRWSPDGTRLAFLSDRAERGKQSVYVMPVDGGEAARVFDQQGEMSALSWSPDGRYLAVLLIDPEIEEEKQKKEDKDDVKVWDQDRKWRRLWLIDLDENASKAVSPPERQVWSYCWSPDASRLAMNTSPNPRINDIFGQTRVDLVTRDGQQVEELFSLRGITGNMVWSKDGSLLAYQSPNGRVFEAEHVFVMPMSGGEPRNLTPDLDGTNYAIRPFNGGEQLLLHVARGVNAYYRTLTWDGEMAPLVDESAHAGFLSSAPSASSDGRWIAGIWTDGMNAPDVYTLEVESGLVRRRTHMNPDLESAAIGECEVVRWESDPGIEIEGVLIRPYGCEAGKRYPLVVQVHGGPTAQWGNEFCANWHDWGQYLAGRGYAVLMPNPRGSTGYGSEFMNALYGEVGGAEFRDQMSGIEAMVERGIADPERLGIGGWSWGGYMTAWAVTHTDRFKAAVMGAGVSNLVSDNSTGDIPGYNLSFFGQSMFEDADPLWERSPIRYIHRCETPLLILHGEADDRVNMHQSIEIYVALRELGREHQFVTYPRESHSIRERKHQIDLINRIGEWFDRYLKSE